MTAPGWLVPLAWAVVGWVARGVILGVLCFAMRLFRSGHDELVKIRTQALSRELDLYERYHGAQPKINNRAWDSWK